MAKTTRQQNSRSEAARKAWQTRRLRAVARKRSIAALKAWATRRLYARLGL